MTHCTSSVGGVDVHFHGGASWLYNLFSAALESPIRDALKNIVSFLRIRVVLYITIKYVDTS
jgi:hypothetical protein